MHVKHVSCSCYFVCHHQSKEALDVVAKQNLPINFTVNYITNCKVQILLFKAWKQKIIVITRTTHRDETILKSGSWTNF